jgi:hypothetical protein
VEKQAAALHAIQVRGRLTDVTVMVTSSYSGSVATDTQVLAGRRQRQARSVGVSCRVACSPALSTAAASSSEGHVEGLDCERL